MKRPRLPLQIGSIEGAVTTRPTCGAGSRGISSMQIMLALYADDPGGGPESPNIISVMVRTVKLHLEHFGLAIGSRSGPDTGECEREAYARRQVHCGYEKFEEKRSWLTTNPNPNCILSSRKRRRQLLRRSL
jgi:hypothetical protein